METLKDFRLYLFMFIGFFILATILTNFLMREEYKNITNYEIKVESPQVVVTECKVAYSNGYIKGSVTNDKEELIPLKYLQINLYDENNVYLGSEYKELKKIYPKETINFDITFNYIDVNKIIIDVVDEKISKNEINFATETSEEIKIVNPTITQETVEIGTMISSALLINTGLGVLMP